MEKQELSRLLGNIACGLDYWYPANQSPEDVVCLESLLSAAFHDATHLEQVERFLALRMPTEAAGQMEDIPARLVPDEPTPPTQRTGEEEPKKTQVDNLKPAEPIGCSTLPACDRCSGVTNAALCVDCPEANACEGPTSGDGKTCDG